MIVGLTPTYTIAVRSMDMPVITYRDMLATATYSSCLWLVCCVCDPAASQTGVVNRLDLM